MFLNAPHRSHSLSSTTRGATDPKQPHIPSERQLELCSVLLLVLSSVYISDLRRGLSMNLTWGGRGVADSIWWVVQLEVVFHNCVPPSDHWYFQLYKHINASVHLWKKTRTKWEKPEKTSTRFSFYTFIYSFRWPCLIEGQVHMKYY